MGRRPNKLDRAYFEKKKNPKYDDKDALTIVVVSLKMMMDYEKATKMIGD